ncbi:hypothetical protein MTO96_008019 [Rhipicephalus appendiculatus]
MPSQEWKASGRRRGHHKENRGRGDDLTGTMNDGRRQGERNRGSRLLPFVKVPAAAAAAGRNKARLSCSFTIALGIRTRLGTRKKEEGVREGEDEMWIEEGT